MSKGLWVTFLNLCHISPYLLSSTARQMPRELNLLPYCRFPDFTKFWSVGKLDRGASNIRKRSCLIMQYQQVSAEVVSRQPWPAVVPPFFEAAQADRELDREQNAPSKALE